MARPSQSCCPRDGAAGCSVVVVDAADILARGARRRDAISRQSASLGEFSVFGACLGAGRAKCRATVAIGARVLAIPVVDCVLREDRKSVV